MSWKISRKIETILEKGDDFSGISGDEALSLTRIQLHSKEFYALLETANRMSRLQFSGKGELHFHLGLNVEPCPMDCRFCSLARAAGIFTQTEEFPVETVVAWAQSGEKAGADAINIMTTGTYSFQKLLEIGRLLTQKVSIHLVANTRDINHAEGESLLEAGFVGFYHAVRLGEGRDTPFQREKRIRTIQIIRDVGLQWMNCVEPVGPEHAPDEIVDLMLLAREYGAVYSGVMRRINFPGSPMAEFGMINELEMAKLVAVSRLVMGDVPQAHCTHEPHAASLMAGANLFFPEVGSSPRDGIADTGKGRGKSIEECKQLLIESDWQPELPTNCFGD